MPQRFSSSFFQLMQKPVDASTLGLYRIIFGLLMFVEVLRYFVFGKIREHYLKPKFLFTFEWVDFLRPWPGWGMYLFFVLLCLFAVGILFGCFYRFSCFGFAFLYTYLFLLDKADYNNHYYLISLLSFLFLLTNAHYWGSVDRKRKPTLPSWIPFWQIFLFRSQFFFVYFYGGIAKLNFDWFRGDSLKPWLDLFGGVPFFGTLLTHAWSVYFFCYAGLFFDLGIGFLLLWKPARKLCIVLLLFFHVSNSWLFSIGIFPWLGFFSTLVFFEPEWARILFRQAKPTEKIPENNSSLTRGFCFFLGAYLSLQILIPLRHTLYSGEVSWTEEGHRFSWRMKLRDKLPGVYFSSYWSDSQNQYRWTLEILPDGAHEKVEIISRGNTQLREQKKYPSITPAQLEQRLKDLGQKPFLDILPYQTVPIRFYITDTKTHQRWQHAVERDLRWIQIQKMAVIPEMILQYAHYLKRYYEKIGVFQPKVQVQTGCSLNGRPFYPLIDPETNLSEQKNKLWKSSSWILPLPESKPLWETVVEMTGTLLVLLMAGSILIGILKRKKTQGGGSFC